MNFIDENMVDQEDQEYEEQDENQSPQQRVETTYYSEDDEQEKKEEGKKNENEEMYDFGKGPSKGAQKNDTDFVKDTFAKYGLNMNLYNPNVAAGDSYQ